MTDKQLIKTLWNIKEYCFEHIVTGYCDKDCIFCQHGDCLIEKLSGELYAELPYAWDIDRIERIINESD